MSVLSSAAVTNIVIALGTILTTPFGGAVRTVLYHDLQHRHAIAPPPKPTVHSKPPLKETEPERESTRGEKTLFGVLTLGGGTAIIASVVAVHIFGAGRSTDP